MRARIRWLVCLAPTVLIAQPVKRIPLAAATEKLNAEFIGVTSVREIADGRVVVADGHDQQLYVADFKANSASLIGGKGKGPGEWTSIGFVVALSGDSSIMGDTGNQRWLLFHGARIVGHVPPDHPAVIATSATISGIDRYGRILTTKNPPLRNGSITFTRADSNTLVFIDRATGKTDTIGKIREQPYRRENKIDSTGRVLSSFPYSTEPNPQAELAKQFFDGAVAVIRLEPLRVDWRSPTGEWTRGKPFPLRAEIVDTKERKAIEVRRAEARAQARKNGLPDPTPVQFPTSLPIMARNVLPRASSDGRLLIRRTSSASNPSTRYLIVNRRGGIDGEIVLAPNEDIVGFGPKSIYITSKDDDDIQRLRRHPFP